ncbi:hypothetical protein BDV06DRAFT_183961 [Aspergillus oleicola]
MSDHSYSRKNYVAPQGDPVTYNQHHQHRSDRAYGYENSSNHERAYQHARSHSQPRYDESHSQALSLVPRPDHDENRLTPYYEPRAQRGSAADY